MSRPVRSALNSLVAGACLGLCLLAVGCKRAAPPPGPEKQLVIFAAASLRDAFSHMQSDFLWDHRDAEITFNFSGTQQLRTQLEQGAAADVFASADQKHMGELVKAGRVGAPVVFARNEPVVVVANDAATKVHSFAELPLAERIVVGAPEVPIGRYTLEILDRASASLGADFGKRVQAKIVSRELDVRHVLAKVTLGEADAAVVYASDARAARDRVTVVPIPAAANVIAEYPIAVVANAAHPALARAWVQFVLGKGQQALSDAGFRANAGDRPAP
jgi:molybdate transport system substrate-binding protein